MTTSTIEGEVSLLMADADAIMTIATEVQEAVEVNSPEDHKLHAIYSIAENQLRRLDRIEDRLMELRRLLKTE